MSESEQTPESAESANHKQKISRRKVVQAGLIAVPVLMTLPVTPAWAAAANSTQSTCRNPTANPATQSCAIIKDRNRARPTPGRGDGGKGSGGFDNPFRRSGLGNPYQKK